MFWIGIEKTTTFQRDLFWPVNYQILNAISHEIPINHFKSCWVPYRRMELAGFCTRSRPPELPHSLPSAPLDPWNRPNILPRSFGRTCRKGELATDLQFFSTWGNEECMIDNDSVWKRDKRRISEHLVWSMLVIPSLYSCDRICRIIEKNNFNWDWLGRC